MERLFKYGFFHISKKHKVPIIWRNFITNKRSGGWLVDNFLQYRNNNNLFMLSAGYYAGGDMKLIKCFKKKNYVFGYFPKVYELNIEEVIDKKQNQLPKILWVGRFLDWKHPEACVALASYLKRKGYIFKLSMVGIGPLYETINDDIKKHNLDDCVELVGQLSNEQVREMMLRSNIFLFTSDYREG